MGRKRAASPHFLTPVVSILFLFLRAISLLEAIEPSADA